MRSQPAHAVMPLIPTKLTSQTTLSNLRWAQIQSRQPASTQSLSPLEPFLYAVITTKIYCLPSCPSRKPRRSNVQFFSTRADAIKAGFRACKRCKPDQNENGQVGDEGKFIVTKACAYLDQVADDVVGVKKSTDSIDEGETSTRSVKLADVADVVGLSPRYFHGLFKRITSLTPAEYYSLALLKRRKQKQQQQGQDAEVQFEHAGFVWNPDVDPSLIESAYLGSSTIPTDFFHLTDPLPEDFELWYRDQQTDTPSLPTSKSTSLTPNPDLDLDLAYHPSSHTHTSTINVERIDTQPIDQIGVSSQELVELYNPATYARLEKIFDRSGRELLDIHDDSECTDLCLFPVI